MTIDLRDLSAFAALAKARGFREAARIHGGSASGYSEALRRLEAEMAVRLVHRTTRSVMLTAAGEQLLARLAPALQEIETSVLAVQKDAAGPTGTLRLNVPVSAAQLVLPHIVPAFLAAHPNIVLEVAAESATIAIPIGPRVQRFATAASPGYLARMGRPQHPRELLAHHCIRTRFASGILERWEFERESVVVKIDPTGPLILRAGATVELAVQSAIAGTGIVHIFEPMLSPHFASGALEPVLEPWWQEFPGAFLYYYGNRLVPTPLRAFIDFVKMFKGF